MGLHDVTFLEERGGAEGRGWSVLRPPQRRPSGDSKAGRTSELSLNAGEGDVSVRVLADLAWGNSA